MQIFILIAILLIALVYLHIKRDHLIFQPDIKLAKIILIIAVAVTYIGNAAAMLMNSGDARQFIPWCDLAVWGLVIFSYWKFFAGCRKFAYLKKVDSADPLLRAKVRGLLIDVIDKGEWTSASKMVFQVSHEDPLVESISRQCERMYYPNYALTEKELEKLKGFAEKLKD